MSTREETVIKKITADFTKAVTLFKKKKFKDASAAFGKIVDENGDSDYYSVLEIQKRSEVLKNISDYHSNPDEVKEESDADLLNNAVVSINSSKCEKAAEILETLGKKDYRTAYVFYLQALLNIKLDQPEKVIEWLSKSVEKDAAFKVAAYNEPMFEPFLENEEFLAVVE